MAQYPKPNAKKIFFPCSSSSRCSLREEEEEEEQEGKDLQRRRRREREEKEEKEEEETVGRVVEVRIFSFNLMMFFVVFQSKFINKIGVLFVLFSYSLFSLSLLSLFFDFLKTFLLTF